VRTLLARTPLRVKLVAAVLALVTAALMLSGVASVVAMRRYLVGRIDDQLQETAARVDLDQLHLALRQDVDPNFLLPSDYALGIVSVGAVGKLLVGQSGSGPHLGTDDLPRLPVGREQVQAHIGVPYTVPARDNSPRWRLLLTWLPNDSVLVVAQQLTEVEHAEDRLVTIDLLVGIPSLLVLAAMGVALVRASLVPLVKIEQTAAAIADGRLGWRVPEADTRTEVGRLGRALNLMLAHLEGAFVGRAASEQAARDAAAVAMASEARARRSEERMRQFVADASHELRTPLTSIRGFAELYRQGAAREPEETQALLRRIEDEAARMGLLVADLLLLARLDQERPLTLGPVDLRTVAADTVSAACAVAPEREITLDSAPDQRPPVVTGDEPRLRQVIGNLMTNALTHTPPGTPVALGLAVDGDHAVVEVRDRGPGLDPTQAERVFERFYRVDKARTRRAAGGEHSGTGLGLAIVAALVSAHHGVVEVDSEPGNGATFRVRLPLSDVDGKLSVTSQADPSSVEARPGNLEA
jgi:two-component system OmpR family sensor kinase